MAHNAKGSADIQDRYQQWTKRGANMRLLEGAECQEYCGTDKIPSALLDLRCGTVNPFAYANALASNGKGLGTIPHALIAAYNGDTLAATSAFDKYVAPDIARIALVDFDNDCVGTTLQVARKLGRKLAGVRLDTSGTMVDKSLLSQMGMFKPTGVCKELVHNVRTALDAEGFDYVKIIVSGGFDAERIKEFEALKVPVDTYAVGSSLFDGNINFTADIVMVDGKECAKAGRVHLPNPRLELVK